MDKQTASNGGKSSKRLRLGELLVQSGRITEAQLQDVLKRQAQTGGHLGSVLIEMGFIAVEDLLRVLGDKLGVSTVNLFNLDIDPQTIRLIPMGKITSLNILPVAVDAHTLTLAMVNPQDFETIRDLEFTLGKKIRPRLVPSFMMDAAIKSLTKDPEKGIRGASVVNLMKLDKVMEKQVPPLAALLRSLSKTHASDLLLTPGAPPSLKINNEIKRLPTDPLMPRDCEKYASELMPKDVGENFSEFNDIEFAVTFPDIARFRVTAYKQRGSISLAIRSLPERIPPLKDLNLPEWISGFALKSQGLILVTGLAGHGKTMTLNAMVDIVNNSRRCNVVMLEEPVEYLHKHRRCNINQREVGRDVKSFSEGLRHVFRQAPDVIVIGELRDRESVEIALRASVTGYLVMATVNSDTSTTIIEQMIEMFEPERQNLVRSMLADALLVCLAQRLIKDKSGQSRVLALEKLVNSHRVKKIIREEKTLHVRTQMQAGTQDFTSLDISMANLCKEGRISYEDALVFAKDPQFFNSLVPETMRS